MKERENHLDAKSIEQRDRDIAGRVPRRFDSQETIAAWLVASQKVLVGARFMGSSDLNYQVVSSLNQEDVKTLFREIPVKYPELSRNAYAVEKSYELFLAR